MMRSVPPEGGITSSVKISFVARVLPGMLLMFLMTREVLGQRLVPHEYDEIAREAVRVFLYGTILRASAAQDVGRGPKEDMHR